MRQHIRRSVIRPFYVIKAVLAVALFLLSISIVNGQSTEKGTGEVHGRFMDSSLVKERTLILITLLRPDSSLVRLTHPDRGGAWQMTDIPAGRYEVLISCPGYADYAAPVGVVLDSITDLGRIELKLKLDSLAPVYVSPRAPVIHIRGDTLEYGTGNVKLNTNATVEELLNRLPGVTVDQNGVITVNGQKVQKLLVDGEDIFASDPSVVARNFNADIIAKVQVLDKKSSQAEFTGVDDGERTKTVNLVLKDDKKNILFGKVEAGAGDVGYYNANGVLGAFKGQQQLAVLGMAANMGATGFSSGGGSGAGLSVAGGSSDALGASAGAGIPQAEGGGVHYADKWNGDGEHVSGNYSYGALLTRPYSTAVSQQTLPDSVYGQAQSNRSVNSSSQQRFNGDYDWKPDTLSAFRVSVFDVAGNGHNQFTSTGSSSFNDTMVNTSSNNIRDQTTNQNFGASLMWRKQNRKNRLGSISLTAGGGWQANGTSGYLYTIDNFYSGGNIMSSDTVDQRKVINMSTASLNGSLNYTQPLKADVVLATAYRIRWTQNQSLQSTFDRGDGKYQELVDSLSNDYRENMLEQRGTLLLSRINRPFTYTLGGDVVRYAYTTEVIPGDSVARYHYSTIEPRVNMRYSLDKFRTISLYYSGSTQLPSIAQMQPVQNNSNPLNITIGNPTLRPSVSYYFGLGLTAVKPSLINFGLNLSMTNNAISNKTYTDSLGRQVTQAVNVNGNERGGLYLGLSQKIRPIDIGISENFNLSLNRNVNYIENIISDNDTYNTGGGIVISKFVPDHYNISISSSVNYSYAHSSINTATITKYWTSQENAVLSYFPLPGLELNTVCNYLWQQKASVSGKDITTIIWDAYLSQNFLSNKWTLRFRINNILDQNSGISRSISANIVSQTVTNVIGRYWMVSLIYRFDGRVKH